MLKKSNRLDASTRLHHAKTIGGIYFTCKITSNILSQSRFGFILSKRIDKRATVRNHARRVISSCIEKHLQKIKPGKDVLFIVKKSINDASRDDINKEVERILKQEALI